MKSEKYEQWFSTPFGKYADRLEKKLVFEMLGNIFGKKILDVGCGTGNYSLELASSGAEVYGIDSSEEMLEAARKMANESKEHITLQNAKAESLPFEKNEFDIIVCITACEFTNLKSTSKEMLRVLKPDGKLVLGILNKFSLYALQKSISSKLKKSSSFSGANFLTPWEIKKFFKGEMKWESTLYAQDWFPAFLLNAFKPLEGPLSIILKPFGAFIAIEIKPKMED